MNTTDDLRALSASDLFGLLRDVVIRLWLLGKRAAAYIFLRQSQDFRVLSEVPNDIGINQHRSVEDGDSLSCIHENALPNQRKHRTVQRIKIAACPVFFEVVDEDFPLVGPYAIQMPELRAGWLMGEPQNTQPVNKAENAQSNEKPAKVVDV